MNQRISISLRQNMIRILIDLEAKNFFFLVTAVHQNRNQSFFFVWSILIILITIIVVLSLSIDICSVFLLVLSLSLYVVNIQNNQNAMAILAERKQENKKKTWKQNVNAEFTPNTIK